MRLFSPQIEAALRRAVTLHSGQTRKGSDVPYVTHPIHVATILMRAGFDDDETLAAALLHDVVEDCDLGIDELRAEFSKTTIDLVSSLTERKRDRQGNARPWEDRKAEHLEEVSDAPLQAKAIFLADKLHNLATLADDLEQHGSAVWSRFNAPRERLLWYYRAGVDVALSDDARLTALAQECTELMARIEAAD